MTEIGRETDDFSVPNGWQVAPLGKFGDFRSGNGFPLRYQGGQSGEIPFYKVSDMSGDGNSMLMANSNHWIDEGTRRVLGAHIMPPNAIIFAKIGAAIFLERRRLLSMNSCIDNNVMAFLPSATEANPLFFYYLLQSVPFGPLVAATALPSLSGKAIGALSFCFPPLHEQERIASALKDIDDLIASLDALIAKKRDIKQAAMQQLLTGKTRLAGFEGEWKSVPLSQISEFITKGATPTTYGFGWQSDGILFLRSECVAKDGPDLSQSMFISEEANRVLRRSEVRSGDILMTITGNVGRVVLLPLSVPSANINQHIARIRIRAESAFAPFIFHHLTQRCVREHFCSIVTGQAYPQISLKQVRDATILLPSLREQMAIASVLTDMDDDIELIEEKLEKVKQVKGGMMQQLLTGRIRLV